VADDAETVWTDSTSGLTWQDGETVGTTPSDFADAPTYCTGLTWNGLTGWRLPDVDELRSLLRGCTGTDTGGSCGVTDSCLNSTCVTGACAGCSSLGGPAPGGAYWPAQITGSINYYWTASAEGDVSGNGWYVDFRDGAVAGLDGNNGGSLRCVQ
jgi:hypothetical protein